METSEANATNNLVIDEESVPMPMSRRNVIPASIITQEAPADFTNVQIIQRLLVQEGKIVCFCKSADGLHQLSAQCKNKAWVCHNINAAENVRKCGFRINQTTLKYLSENDLLLHADPIKFPVCKVCGGSWIFHTESEKARTLRGQVSFVCNCMPFNKKINISITDEHVCADWDLRKYHAIREKLFGIKSPEKISQPQFVQQGFYIPQ